MAGGKTWRVAAMSSDDSGTMPRTVLLFSGHMIDAPGRKQPRFPADKELIARDAIVDTLTQAGGRARGIPACCAALGGGARISRSCLPPGPKRATPTITVSSTIPLPIV